MVMVGEWFSLPRLGRDKFISLMKAGLIYDRSKGFKAEAEADLITIKSILKTALAENFEFVPKCFVCNSSVDCYLCAYYHICNENNVKPNCLCNKCVSIEAPLSNYTDAFMKKLSQLNHN